jgi:hypothetical protein
MINDVVQLLISERDKLDRAIAALQSGSVKRGRAAGRQAGATASGAVKLRKRGGMSAEARQAQSERMKAYWAKRRRQKGKG